MERRSEISVPANIWEGFNAFILDSGSRLLTTEHLLNLSFPLAGDKIEL